MKVLKRILRGFKQKLMSSVGIVSPSLEQAKLVKEIVEAVHERQKETNKAK